MRPTTTTTTRRAATAVATIGLASLVTLAPAQARTDPGTPLPSAGTPADSSRFDNDRSGSTTPSDSSLHRGVGATSEENRVSREQIAPRADLPGPATMIRVDDDAVEYLQIGLGALTGVALFGAAAAAVSASHRRHAHPA
ncbi:hypothetical protein N798_17270 [Knoellia flava TL1]|uniref:Uncharacterized protein n=2 Tax=Knoellia flava TaxID=913969 RepID=A0A8H9FWH0_9MICO|nr:hypothetical protein [Knoellia flava]KGN28843.1 hypothetical protein N798_17270 [Knoellia flava TL1]GGB85599.1 hypothetical protein GCM10011314_26650 [Knoellia flava]